MARRAVKGYPGKSLYENTTYVGVVATNDPLYEGTFRQIVNFIIEDTGRSVKPREGYLSTSLVGEEIITISANSFIYFESRIGSYVVVDLHNKKHYIADIDFYDIENKLLPLNDASHIELSWTDLIQFIINKFKYLQDMIETTGVEHVTDYVLNHISLYKNDKSKYFTDMSLIKKGMIKLVYSDPNENITETITTLINMKFSGKVYNADGSNGYVYCWDSGSGDGPPDVEGPFNSKLNILINHDYYESGSFYGPSRSLSLLADTGVLLNGNIFVGEGSYTDVKLRITPPKIDPSLNKGLKVEFTTAKNRHIFDDVYEFTIYADYHSAAPNFDVVHLKDIIVEVNGDSYTIPGEEITMLKYFNPEFPDVWKGHYVPGYPDDYVWGTIYVYYEVVDNTDYVLAFEPVDYEQHPTYDISNRNIANPNSIIPDPMQHFYKPEDRPDGFVNVIGQLYVQDVIDKKYYLNEIFPLREYDIIPHFELNPPSLMTSIENSDWWFRFDIVGNNVNNPITIRTMWYTLRMDDYINDNEYNVFKWFNLKSGEDLDNSIYSKRHTQGVNKVIYIMPKQVRYKDSTNGWVSHVVNQNVDNAEYDNLYSASDEAYIENWGTNVTSIMNMYQQLTPDTLERILNNLEFSSRFLYADMTIEGNSTLRNDMNKYNKYSETKTFVQLSGSMNLSYNPYGPDIDDIFEKHTLSAKDILKYKDQILAGNVVFRTVPCVLPIKQTITNYSVGTSLVTYYIYQFVYTTPAIWGKFYEGYKTYYRYNPYNYSDYEPFEYITKNDVNVGLNIRVNTHTLKEYFNFDDDEYYNYFGQGFTIVFYTKAVSVHDVPIDEGPPEYIEFMTKLDTIANVQTRLVTIGYSESTVLTIPEHQDKYPMQIKNTENYLIHKDAIHVCWSGNNLFISEEMIPYYFRLSNMKEFDEPIVHVIEFKNILLVFTTLHLYAVYQLELTSSSTDAAGNTVQSSTYIWAKQTVLYNILPDRKYIEAIKVFNQMILFYSSEGQLCLIKPSTTINDETRFSLQYLNKSVNDILLNYDKYITERLRVYNIEKTVTKQDVVFTTDVSINFIKLIYTVPGVITYIVIYDVLKNIFLIEDTLTFTEIHDKIITESGMVYITKHKNNIYFTTKYTEPFTSESNVDMHLQNNFKKIAISTMLDTGNIDLNIHLKKRFRNMNVLFKTMNASKVLFNLETYIDDIVAKPFYTDQIEVREQDGRKYMITVPKANHNDLVDLIDVNYVSEVASNAFRYALDNNLFENQNLLFDFSEYTTSKLLHYRTSVLGSGYVLRMKLQFVSKGTYKIQTFGVVFKERGL